MQNNLRAPLRRARRPDTIAITEHQIQTEPQEAIVMATTESAKREASAAAKSAKDHLERGMDEVTSQVRQTGARAKNKAAELEDTLTRGGDDIAATVSDRLRAVGVDADRMVDVAREQVSELQQLVEDEIRERPLRALAIAAAIGLFVGYISAR